MSIFLFGYFSDCQSKTINDEVKEIPEQNAFIPCYTDREVTEEISSIIMTCKSQGEMVILENAEEGKRYSVCNSVDYSFQADGKYIVSGICYKIKPNERWPGTPFQITSLKKSE